MKRLLATTAVGLFLAAGPALADHDVWTILQDFDITSGVPGDQNVINELTGLDVGVTQSGSNLANSADLVDPGAETGTTGDSYMVDQIFDEDQSVANTVTAAGHVTADQSGVGIVNLAQITDAHGGTTDGDTYDIEQLASSDPGAEAGSQTVTNTVGGGATGIGGSNQSGTVQVNALTITDSAGGTSTAGVYTVNQQVATVDDFDQFVNNNATAGTVDGLVQTGTTKANLLTLGLTGQSGGATATVTQNTSEGFDQSVRNVATATGSAIDVTQSGSNAANVITATTQ